MKKEEVRALINEELDKRDYITRAELDARDYVTNSSMRQALEGQRKEYERYMGALAEDFGHKTAIICEGIALALERIDRHIDENARDHEEFRKKILRLQARASLA